MHFDGGFGQFGVWILIVLKGPGRAQSVPLEGIERDRLTIPELPVKLLNDEVDGADLLMQPLR